MRFKDVRLVVGTRPEAIKLSPVARALVERGITPSLILTGQHRDLDPAEYGLGELPAVRIRCPGETDPHVHAGKVTAAVLSLLREPPDLLVVQGDTSSALGAALAGFTAGVPVAHVEAGLRTHDPMLPWPEEEYRTAIDAQAELLFAPTETAAANLRTEEAPGAIHVTGNTGIDALLEIERRLASSPLRDNDAIKTILVTCHRRESWGVGLKSIAEALQAIGDRSDVRIDFVLHPNEHVRRAMTDLLGCQLRICLVPPCSHAEIVARTRDAYLVLSDSGGIQEEAPALGVPLLVLREKTERPEGLAAGNALLVGTSTDEIVENASRLLDDPAQRAAMAQRSFPYGDGHAGPRIAAIIDAWLARNVERAAAS